MELSTLPTILAIVGPTASGKTSLAIEIARRYPSEIVSADSRQVYRLLDIGTGKPTPAELSLVKHHFVGELLPDRHFNAGEFGIEGRRIIGQIVERKKLPLVVGGTGLYVRALIDGLFPGPGRETELREELEEHLETEGAGKLLEELKKVDPKSAARMLPSNKRRIVRALEVYYATGRSISEHHDQQKPEQYFNAVLVALRWERNALYERINARVDRMLAAGFLDEVKALQALGYDDRYKSLQTVGYKEAFAFLRGEIAHARMVELMKQSTRRFAKRQLTWFRKDERIRWFDIREDSQIPLIAAEILDRLGL